MKFHNYKSPFSHYIIEDVFPPHLLLQIESFFENTNISKPYTHKKFRYGKDIRVLPEVYKYIVDNKNKFFSICKEELLIKRNMNANPSEYHIFDSTLCLDTNGYTIERHTDTLCKAITIVIYLNNEGSTTTLHDSLNGNICYNIPKIKNTALMFVPEDNVTWHSVERTFQNRHTIQLTFKEN